MVKAAIAKGKRALVVAHRRQLVEQAAAKLVACNVIPGLIMAGRSSARGQPCQVASKDSLINRELPPADLVILDEAHMCTSDGYAKIIAHYIAAGAVVAGVTATPWGPGGAGLGDVFDSLVVGPSVGELIAQGHLAPYDAKGYVAPDLTNVPIRGNDYEAGALELACNTPTIIGSAVDEYIAHAKGRPFIAFPASVKTSIAVAAEFEARGIRCAHIDADTPDDVRVARFAEYERGELLGLLSVGVLSVGFDMPRAEVALLLRPTMSTVLHLQQIGRVLRPYPGKARALIHDHADNLIKHGLPDETREYSLTGKVSDDRPRTYKCPFCSEVMSQLRDDGKCRACGEKIAPVKAEREENARRELKRIEGERIDAEEIKKRRAAELARQASADSPVEREKFFREKEMLGFVKGYKPGWAKKQYQIRYGTWPNYRPRKA